MGFRITTNMMMNSYRYNLQNSTKKLSDARDQVLTQRKFNSYADDPAAAAQAFRLRRTFYQTDSQLNNTKDVYSKFNTAWNNLTGVVENLSDATARVASIRGNNGTAGESRKALATVLRETSESVVHAMNQQLGDHFIFAGNDGLRVPFEWKGEELYFRGVNVNAGGVEQPPEATRPTWAADVTNTNFFNEDGTPKLEEISNAVGGALSDEDKAWVKYYNDQADLKKLEEMSKEELYIDLGMGASEIQANMPVKGSYFDSALSGVDFIGYGRDEDGDPKNLSLIMRELADVFETWGENGQKYLPEEYRDMSAEDLKTLMKNDKDVAAEINAYHSEAEAKAFRLMDKLKAAQEHTTEKWVELDAQSVFLQTNEEQLSTQKTDINLEILNVEQVDLADAITTFSWDQYCYNAALKIGNQLLSQSLIDYMS